MLPGRKEVDFRRIAKKALGKNYQLSIVFCGNTLSKKLNAKYRGKNEATNILSFPLEKKCGEIFLNLNRAKLESKRVKIKGGDYACFLFAHGVAHLAGYTHGEKMDAFQKHILKKG